MSLSKQYVSLCRKASARKKRHFPTNLHFVKKSHFAKNLHYAKKRHLLKYSFTKPKNITSSKKRHLADKHNFAKKGFTSLKKRYFTKNRQSEKISVRQKSVNSRKKLSIRKKLRHCAKNRHFAKNLCGARLYPNLISCSVIVTQINKQTNIEGRCFW